VELQEFIATSLTQIVNGVLEAQRAVRDSGALVSPQMRATHSTESIGPAEGHGGQPVFRVEFDVAVTAMSGQGSKAGIGVMVGSLGLGAKGHSESTSNRDSRLRFSIPLLLPLQQSEKPK
jgi:hypothetical protein